MDEFIYALISVIIVSLCSLVGILTFSIKEQELKKFLLLFVAFSAGTLLGAAFLHLIPESAESLGAAESMLYVLVGIFLFLIIESFIHWHHCMKDTCIVHPKKTIGMMNVIGDGIHNFTDGVLIAAAYLISVPIGVGTTIAVIAHEIPQELGDFAVLLHSGFSKQKALLYNFISALTAVAGMLIGFFFLQSFSSYLPHILSLGAGGFIYIALADLFPEINKSRNMTRLVIQTLAVFIGIVLLYSVVSAMPHTHIEGEEHTHEHEENTEEHSDLEGSIPHLPFSISLSHSPSL